MKRIPFKYVLLPVACLLSVTGAWAHNLNYALEGAPQGSVAWYYTVLGFRHIIPDGLDHILFVLGLCLLDSRIKTILWQATAFTVAHTITLTLSMKNILVLPANIVEPVIALSIAFIALENLVFRNLKPWRIAVVFVFGLIHGMGFARMLNEIGLPPDRFLLSLLSFNLGAEIGQIAVVALVFLFVILPFKKYPQYRRLAVYPISACIALVGFYWTFARLFLN